MVAINFEGLLVSLVNTLAKKPSCFFSISICILLADIKAISIPEKKAENTNETKIMTTENSNFIFGYRVCVAQIFSYNFS
jgi:hypothetical protein